MYKTWLKVKTLITRLTVMYCTVSTMQDYTQDKVLVSSTVAQLVGRTCSEGATSQVSTSRFSSSTCTYSLSEGTVAEQIFGSDPQDHSLHALVSTELREWRRPGFDVHSDDKQGLCKCVHPSQINIRCSSVNHILISKSLQYKSQRKLLWHLVPINPRDGGSVWPRFICLKGQWKNSRSVYVKIMLKSGTAIFSRKKRQPNPHVCHPSA